MRFCSAGHIAPEEVDEAVVDRFMSYRVTTGMAADDAFRRLFARAWNANVRVIKGWPARRLDEPALKRGAKIAWGKFPDGLRRDVEAYLATLTRFRLTRNKQRIRPLKPSTIAVRRAELQAAARMAIKAGVPIDSLTSLSALIAPEVAEKVLEAYLRRNGETPKLFTIDLACRFVRIARETKCLDDAACARLDEMRQALEEDRQPGLTDKNIALIRHVLTPGVWNRVVKLPLEMMAMARKQQAHRPTFAAVTAQLAVAIAILTVAPVRLANLNMIRLGTNLIKPGGPASQYWLVFPDHDVKNRVKLEHRLPDHVTKLIDEYVQEFWPALLRGRNEDLLFLGKSQGSKNRLIFSRQITERIAKATGLRITVHQFRHAAGALILRARPGEYQLVRQLLGHRSIQTTMSAYVGLDSIQASEIYGNIVVGRLNETLRAAQ